MARASSARWRSGTAKPKTWKDEELEAGTSGRWKLSNGDGSAPTDAKGRAAASAPVTAGADGGGEGRHTASKPIDVPKLDALDTRLLVRQQWIAESLRESAVFSAQQGKAGSMGLGRRVLGGGGGVGAAKRRRLDGPTASMRGGSGVDARPPWLSCLPPELRGKWRTDAVARRRGRNRSHADGPHAGADVIDGASAHARAQVADDGVIDAEGEMEADGLGQRQAAEANGGAAAEDADGAEYSDGEEDDGEVSDGDYAQGQEFDDDEGYPGDGDESGDDEPVL